MVKHFFTHCDLPASINAANLVLLPKREQPSSINDYRPIALCNVAYKIISKLLANRLRPLLPILVSPMQSAFVKGRVIHDNSMVVQEILHSMQHKRNKDGYFLVKLDMEKAYDRLDWHFLKAVLSNWGFHDTFVGWIMKCVSTSTFSLLLNGAKAGNLTPSRGLRQDDPLSPALFIIATDVLSRLLLRAESQRKIFGIKVARRGNPITHLLFADDIVLFGRASEREAQNLMECMDIFCSWSGEKVSKSKSAVHFSKSVPNAKRMALAEFLQMLRVKGDCPHLGLPLLASRSRAKDLRFILDKVNNCVQGWKANMLSKAGRSTLVQAVGSSLISYVAASRPMPCSLHESVDKALRSFWWGDTTNKRRMHTLSWGKLCMPKLSGGLGFRTSKTTNEAFMAKRAWEILVGKQGIWHDLIWAKYLKEVSILSYMPKQNDSRLWKGIMRSVSLLKKGLGRRIGNGNSTSIWYDNWLPTTPHRPVPLMDASYGVSWVSQFIENKMWNVAKLSQWFAKEDMERITKINIPMEDKEDNWIWLHDPIGNFSIRSAFTMPFVGQSQGAEWKCIWKSKIHTRLKHLWWKIVADALPTSVRLAQLMDVRTSCCLFCGEAEETSFHLFWKCNWIAKLWFANLYGLRTEQTGIENWRDWFSFFDCHHNMPAPLGFEEFFIQASFLVDIIWRERNAIAHGSTPTSFIVLCTRYSGRLAEWNMDSCSPKESQPRWFPPPLNWLCFSSDVAISENGTTLVAVCRDSSDSIITIITEVVQEMDPTRAEALALLLVARSAVQQASTPYIFQSDCKTVVDVFQKNSMVEAPNLSDIKLKFQGYCAKLCHWECSKIDRAVNFMAHNSAKFAHHYNLVGKMDISKWGDDILNDYKAWIPP
ncbi:uncharacterized protein LOC133785782 [Humulus lupulus]|uniref:uncharacterized protein LOC133785782 n=1 Tax=Humulus lupulus TaxID=3486 RepID=UPI002B40E59E|nr:uncharacterized protein LOC133785782 [Humulus lupulus]